MILDLPIEARNLSAQMAHKEEVPSYASIKIRGTGRDLFKSILLKNYAGFKLVLDLEMEFLKNMNLILMIISKNTLGKLYCL